MKKRHYRYRWSIGSMLTNHVCSKKECLNENITHFWDRRNKFFAKSFAQLSAKKFLQKLQVSAIAEKTNDTRNLTDTHFQLITTYR